MPKRLKKITLAIFAALFITLPFISAFAHPGRTDSEGGHINHSSNSYHYHHGYSAHQHNDGYCPIEPDNERYYSEFYKFKLFLAKVPKEFICITPIVIILLLAPLFYYVFKKKQSHKEESVLKTEEPQKAEKQNQDNVVYVNYKREYIYDTMLKLQKNPTYVIGKDIPSGNFVFSTSSEQNKFAFVRIYPADGSEHRDVRIYGNKQTVALAYGETIELCNCRITDSPKIIHPQEKPIVYIVGENIEKGVYTVFRHQPKDGLVKVYEDNKHTKSILIDRAKNVKFKNGLELRLYNCDIKR